MGVGVKMYNRAGAYVYFGHMSSFYPEIGLGGSDISSTVSWFTKPLPAAYMTLCIPWAIHEEAADPLSRGWWVSSGSRASPIRIDYGLSILY